MYACGIRTRVLALEEDAMLVDRLPNVPEGGAFFFLNDPPPPETSPLPLPDPLPTSREHERRPARQPHDEGAEAAGDDHAGEHEPRGHRDRLPLGVVMCGEPRRDAGARHITTPREIGRAHV